MNNIRGIVFDKDGTLLDFNRTWIPPYRAAADYLHRRFGENAHADALLMQGGFIAETESWQPDSLLASGCNREIIEFWEQVIGHLIQGEDRDAINSIFTLSKEAYIPVIDDIESLFSDLRRLGISLGLATMDDESNAHSALDALGVDGLFDFVCGADSGHGIKPEPGMVLAFCRECGLSADQVMMVGDSPKDLNMGKNAGAALTVGVLTGAHEDHHLSPYADFVLQDITGVLSMLAN